MSCSRQRRQLRVALKFVNFYEPHAVNPYVPLGARGPWIVTSPGAVLHDSGGYGMLGFGHSPQEIIDCMSQSWVIANIMTPSFSQKRLTDALRAEVGHSRPDDEDCPFHAFVCMNSGSESVSPPVSPTSMQRSSRLPARATKQAVKFLAIQGGFHGRTDCPAQASTPGTHLP